MDKYTHAYYKRLTNDALNQAVLSRYRGAPAVFTSKPVPGDAEYPYVVTVGEASPSGLTTDAIAGERVIRDVYVVDEMSGSAAQVDMLADNVSRLFSWSGLSTPDFRNWIADASRGIEWSVTDAQARRVRTHLFKSTVSAGTVGFERFEIPAESPNSSRTNFSTTRTFTAGTLMVVVDNVWQYPGTDFVEDSDRKGYTFTTAPDTGMELWHTYHYETS